MKFWITKYALTAGIQVVDCDDPVHSEFPELLTVPGKVGGYTQHFHGDGKDWHRSHEEALAKANAMRDKKN